MGLQQSDVLSLIALLVSLVALVTTVLQVLQQYFSSAEGYRRCADSVMGKVWIRLFFFCCPAPGKASSLVVLPTDLHGYDKEDNSSIVSAIRCLARGCFRTATLVSKR